MTLVFAPSESELPAVERTLELCQVPAPLSELATTVRAGIVKSFDLALARTHHHNRIIQDVVGDEITYPRDFFQTTCNLPHIRPEAISLKTRELGTGLIVLRQEVGRNALGWETRSLLSVMPAPGQLKF